METARAYVELTRAEMTTTVDTLQEKLDPETIKEQAKTRVTGTARDAGTRVAQTARQNPAVPVALARGPLGLDPPPSATRRRRPLRCTPAQSTSSGTPSVAPP